MRIFIPAMGRVNTKNRDGSEVRFSEIAKRWLAWGQELVVMLPKRQIGVFESQGVFGMDYRVFPEPFTSESDSLGNVLKTYLWRLFRCLFVVYPDKLESIYAPSDFLVDLIPALLAKLKNSKAKLTVCVFLIAPNRDDIRMINKDVRSHQHGIRKESVRWSKALTQFVLIGMTTLQQPHRRHD